MLFGACNFRIWHCVQVVSAILLGLIGMEARVRWGLGHFAVHGRNEVYLGSERLCIRRGSEGCL